MGMPLSESPWIACFRKAVSFFCTRYSDEMEQTTNTQKHSHTLTPTPYSGKGAVGSSAQLGSHACKRKVILFDKQQLFQQTLARKYTSNSTHIKGKHTHITDMTNKMENYHYSCSNIQQLPGKYAKYLKIYPISFIDCKLKQLYIAKQQQETFKCKTS